MKHANEIAIKFYKKIVLFFILWVLASDCSVTPKLNSSFHHDKMNPCSKGEYFDAIECENWKKKFPKEYKRYLERQKNNVKGS